MYMYYLRCGLWALQMVAPWTAALLLTLATNWLPLPVGGSSASAGGLPLSGSCPPARNHTDQTGGKVLCGRPPYITTASDDACCALCFTR